MRSVISNRQVSPASALQRRAWALPLLVMAVLCGVLAMHGLPAAPPDGAHSHRAAAHSAPAAAAVGHAAHGDVSGLHGDGSRLHGDGSRPHGDDPRLRPGSPHAGQCECDGTDGHVAHADATCAASGTNGSPSMDGPAAGTAAGPQPATGLHGWCGPDTGAERAPPSLHHLQLLRI